MMILLNSRCILMPLNNWLIINIINICTRFIILFYNFYNKLNNNYIHIIIINVNRVVQFELIYYYLIDEPRMSRPELYVNYYLYFPQTFEQRAIITARHLSVKLKHSYSKLVSFSNLMPTVFYQALVDSKVYIDELYKSLKQVGYLVNKSRTLLIDLE